MPKPMKELEKELDRDLPEPKAAERSILITAHVLSKLGRPTLLHDVKARHLWGNYYRVNVYVGANITSVTVAHSYFLELDGAGNFVSCNPKISAAYPLGKVTNVSGFKDERPSIQSPGIAEPALTA